MRTQIHPVWWLSGEVRNKPYNLRFAKHASLPLRQLLGISRQKRKGKMWKWYFPQQKEAYLQNQNVTSQNEPEFKRSQSRWRLKVCFLGFLPVSLPHPCVNNHADLDVKENNIFFLFSSLPFPIWIHRPFSDDAKRRMPHNCFSGLLKTIRILHWKKQGFAKNLRDSMIKCCVPLSCKCTASINISHVFFSFPSLLEHLVLVACWGIQGKQAAMGGKDVHLFYLCKYRNRRKMVANDLWRPFSKQIALHGKQSAKFWCSRNLEQKKKHLLGQLSILTSRSCQTLLHSEGSLLGTPLPQKVSCYFAAFEKARRSIGADRVLGLTRPLLSPWLSLSQH